MSVERLARLNPATCKFDTGMGGLPDLTPQDIAAAIAFVPDGLGREVLIAVGWPDGSDMRKLATLATELASAELHRQFDRAVEAGIRHALARWENAGKHRQVQVTQQDQIRMAWPRNAVERLPAIISACVAELAKPNLCECCDGHGRILQGELIVDCAECTGTGRVPMSDRKRAAMIGVSAPTYATHGWGRVYGWMLHRISDAYYDAHRELSQALA